MRTFKLCLIALAAFALALCAFGMLVCFVVWNLDPAEWGAGARALLLIFGLPTAICAGGVAGSVADTVLE